MMRQYQNKQWLYNKYWIEKLSTWEIAKLCGVSQTIIRYWLKKYDIPCRSHNEANHLIKANHCNLSQKAVDWISGELLGDGSLQSYSAYSAQFTYGSKYLEYINYISDTLESFGIKQSGEIYKQYCKKMDSHSYHYHSHCYVELLPIRRRWYPYGKKIIPRDIKLNPITLRQHYIGDGSITRPKKTRPRIQLATCGFKISDVEWLVEQLIKLGFKATRWPFSNMIAISTYATKAFLDYIGSCPVKCYQYKWNYQDNRRILA